ncbi:unnamed protein product [Onchocerca flexuosa]|uniref:Secreted protein n=1 Tax=Onchocerca flexuosa TaxID=387005 RepID=A0A183HI90_9BILA|nr:unnamed protein product [Onchocerca flexuosa]
MNTYRMLIFAAFVFISTTSLLPWNLFMNAHEVCQYYQLSIKKKGLVFELFLFSFSLEKSILFQYYHYKLRNVTENISLSDEKDGETELQRSYEGYITLTGGVSCAFGSGINLLATKR